MKIAETLLEQIGTIPEELDVNVVLGEPQTVGGTTLVPVAETLVGFGLGTGSACCDGEACECEAAAGPKARGGGHVMTRPVATIEVGPDGTRVQPIVDTQRVTVAATLLSLWVFGWLGLVLKVLLNRERT